MNLSIRSLLAASALAIVLAACGTAAATPPETASPPPASPTPAPSEAPETPESPEAPEAPEAPEVVGTITVTGGAAVMGPGGSISDAIASGITDPMLVNGVLYMDTDGSIYLADSLTDASVPTFGGVRLEVVDYPTGGAEWDIANADVTGLQEANGVLFFEDHQLYGVVGS